MADYAFVLKNVLVVSLAMNMCLIWKISYYDEVETLTSKGIMQHNNKVHVVHSDKNNCLNGDQINKQRAVEGGPHAHVSNVFATTTTSSPNHEEEGVVINLDQ